MKYLGVLVLLLVTALTVSAQQPWLTDTERTRFEELRRSGLDALYNIDYDKAQTDFKEIVKLNPNHPGGYQLLAARLWIKTLYESRRLQVSLYSSESFYASGDDKVDPKIVTEFRNLTREAKRLAEARLKQEPKSIEALDFLASRGRALDPKKQGVNIVLDAPVEYRDAKITLSLQNVPLGEALRYAAQLANLVVVEEPYALVLTTPMPKRIQRGEPLPAAKEESKPENGFETL